MKHLTVGLTLTALLLAGGVAAGQELSPEIEQAVAGGQPLAPDQLAQLTGWLDAQFQALANDKLTIDARLAARDQILAKCGPTSPMDRAAHNELCNVASGLVRPLLTGKDAFTRLNAGYLLANVRHLRFVQLLADSVASKDAAVRYYAAKGLAGLQPAMYRLGSPVFFNQPLNKLAAQAADEDSAPVVEEIYRALALTEPRTMTDETKRSAIRKAFLAAFKGRTDRLGKGQAGGASAEVVALEVSRAWFDVCERDKALRNEIVKAQAQLLQFAIQTLHDRRAGLDESAVGGLQQALFKAVEVLAGEARDPNFSAAVRRLVAEQPDDWGKVWITINDFVGGPGMTTWKTKQVWGIDEAPRLMAPPAPPAPPAATQP